ncbi:MAG TPA: PilZ domain-containing protein [Allosphingosinicella sp.]|jgi:hypothetical protein
MNAVTSMKIYQRAQRAFGLDLPGRGHHVVYRTSESNRCPGCGRANWYVGRATAECGFCGTAVALAEAKWVGASGARPWTPPDAAEAPHAKEKRRHERVDTPERAIQLLIDGSPHRFALHNISEGGVMGDDPVGLEPGATVHVRFEGGILVPAVVKWTHGALTGLAFEHPVLLDSPSTAERDAAG